MMIMYSKPLIMSELKVIHTCFQIDLQFENNITILQGDSGSGRTMVFSIIQEEAIDNEQILCINYRDKDIGELIKQTSGKLLVIDNADVLLSDDIRKIIALDVQNQYLIIGRNPRKLLVTEDNLYELDKNGYGEIIEFTLKRYL